VIVTILSISQKKWRSPAVSFGANVQAVQFFTTLPGQISRLLTQRIVDETSRLRSLTGQSLSRAGKISSCVNWLSAREKIGPVSAVKLVDDLAGRSPAAVRNLRGDGGNVGIIRSPLRASVLPDNLLRSLTGQSFVTRGEDLKLRQLRSQRDCGSNFMSFWHVHRWKVRGVTALVGLKVMPNGFQSEWPITEVLLVCEGCGLPQTFALDGRWELEQLQEAETDKEFLHKLKVKL
jgi:hypothetical protein